MALQIISADERLAEANAKTTMAIFGPSGVGKTSLLKTLPPETTLCVDLEAGMKSVQDWPGDSIPIRAWPDGVDIAILAHADPGRREDARGSLREFPGASRWLEPDAGTTRSPPTRGP